MTGFGSDGSEPGRPVGWASDIGSRARNTDPATSHAAARSVKQTENQRAVMTIMRMMGRPILDEELVREYQKRYKGLRLPRQSDSGLRSRRSELSRGESPAVVQGEKAKMTTGRLGRTWSIKEET